MNIKNTKKPSPRVDVGYLQKFGIQSYGADNLYPQNLTAVTNCSGTAELCLARYAKFIEGNGFNSTELSEISINKRKETADDLLKSISADLARYGGFALHCNYNVFGEITEVAHIPFEQCRLAEEDDLGNISHIVVHPDWRGKKSRSGKTLQVNENTITRINTFNPSAALSQIASVGGEGVSRGVEMVITKDRQLKSVRLHGKEIVPLADYRVVTIDYLAQGNDHMEAFKQKRHMNAPRGKENNSREVIIDYFKTMLKQGKAVDADVEGRIVVE